MKMRRAVAVSLIVVALLSFLSTIAAAQADTTFGSGNGNLAVVGIAFLFAVLIIGLAFVLFNTSSKPVAQTRPHKKRTPRKKPAKTYVSKGIEVEELTRREKKKRKRNIKW